MSKHGGQLSARRQSVGQSSVQILSALPQPEARPDEPWYYHYGFFSSLARGRPDDSGANTAAQPHQPRPSPSTTGLIFPSTFVTSTTDSIPVPATARSPELSGILPGHQEPHPPALPELPQSLRHLARQLSPRGGHRFRRH